MTTSKLIGKLLKFKNLLIVGLTFKRGGALEMAVKPFYKNGCRCQECGGRRGKIVRTRPEPRRWRDIPVGGFVSHKTLSAVD